MTKNEEVRKNLHTNGLNVNGFFIQATSDVPMFVNVSLMGIPLELPEVIVMKVLENYGDISEQFFVKKRMYDVVYKNATRGIPV